MPHDYFDFVNPSGCKTLAEWKSYGRALMQSLNEIDSLSLEHKGHAEEVAGHQDRVRWMIGDWLVVADEIGLKPAIVRKHIGDYLGRRKNKRYSQGTLNNFKTVCATIKSSRRRENLTFSHHLVVAKRKLTPEEQDRALDNAEGFWRDENGKAIPLLRNKEKLSVRELAKDLSTDVFGKKIDAPIHEIIKIRMPIGYYKDLARLTVVVPESRGRVAGLICHLADKYIKEHKAELDASLKTWDEQAPERERESRERQKAIDEWRLANDKHIEARALATYEEKKRKDEENKRKDEERKLAGLPTAEEFAGYGKRVLAAARARKIGNLGEARNLQLFMQKNLGVENIREATCERWEATLAMMEATDPEVLIEMVNSLHQPPAKIESTA